MNAGNTVTRWFKRKTANDLEDAAANAEKAKAKLADELSRCRDQLRNLWNMGSGDYTEETCTCQINGSASCPVHKGTLPDIDG